MIRTALAIILAASTSAIAAPPSEPTPSVRAKAPAVDLAVLGLQVRLDRAGFAPGVIDGKGGQSLTAALRGYQKARGLPVTGKPDQATRAALQPWAPVPTRMLAIGSTDAAGPFAGTIPKEYPDQARLAGLGYRNLLEALAEKFHTTTKTLIALNSPETKLGAGARINVPNVLPASRDYDQKLTPQWRATLAALNVSAVQPKAERLVVDKSDGVLQVYDAGDRLVAQFPATMGSEHDPLPLGKWTVKGAAYNPPFHYNPDLFWDADTDDKAAKLPPGPNGPVGVVWLDLSKPHYGIHGTPTPETIGRSESHGCIRLSNWDAARLSLMVGPGLPAVFQP